MKFQVDFKSSFFPQMIFLQRKKKVKIINELVLTENNHHDFIFSCEASGGPRSIDEEGMILHQSERIHHVKYPDILSWSGNRLGSLEAKDIK